MNNEIYSQNSIILNTRRVSVKILAKKGFCISRYGIEYNKYQLMPSTSQLQSSIFFTNSTKTHILTFPFLRQHFLCNEFEFLPWIYANIFAYLLSKPSIHTQTYITKIIDFPLFPFSTTTPDNPLIHKIT